MPNELPHLELFYQALSTPEGLVIHSTNPAFTIRKLKETKLISLEDAFDCLQIIPSPTTEGEIWILKNAEQTT